MELVAFFIGAFVVIPLILGLALPLRAAWWAWAALVAYMVTAQAVSGEVEAFVVMIVLLAAFGSLFVGAGAYLRARRHSSRRTRQRSST